MPANILDKDADLNVLKEKTWPCSVLVLKDTPMPESPGEWLQSDYWPLQGSKSFQ